MAGLRRLFDHPSVLADGPSARASLAAREHSPFRVLVPAWIIMWLGMGALTGPWRARPSIRPHGLDSGAFFFAVGIFIYSRSGAHFSWAQLGGLPEVRPGNHDQRLVTTGIRSRVRHPVYLAISARCWRGASERVWSSAGC